MINILDYPNVINKIGIDKLNPIQKEAHQFISDGSDNFTNMKQMQELMQADNDIRETTEMYLAQLEKFLKPDQPDQPGNQKKKKKHPTQNSRKTGRKAHPKATKQHPINKDKFIKFFTVFKALFRSRIKAFNGLIDQLSNVEEITLNELKKEFKEIPADHITEAYRWHTNFMFFTIVNSKAEDKDQPYIYEPKKDKAPDKPKDKVKKPKKNTKKPVQKEDDNATRIEKVPTAVAYINRYRLMNGKTLPKSGRGSVLSLLNSLQKAIEEKLIRKDDQYAAEIMTMQTELVKLVNTWTGNRASKIEIVDYDHYLSIVKSYVIAPLTALIKRFLKIQGKDSVKAEAAKLLKVIEKHIDQKEVAESDVKDMVKSLNDYVDGKTNSVQISSHALNGLKGLAGVGKRDKKKKWDSNEDECYRLVFEFDKSGDQQFEFGEYFPTLEAAEKEAKWCIRNFHFSHWDLNIYGEDFIDAVPHPTEEQMLNSEIIIEWFPNGLMYEGEGGIESIYFKGLYNHTKAMKNHKYAGVSGKAKRPFQETGNSKGSCRKNGISGMETLIEPDLSITVGDTVETPLREKGIVRRFAGEIAHIDTFDKRQITAKRKLLKKLASLNGPEVINSCDLQKMQFDSLGLKGKFAELIGDPTEPWSMMLYGSPGSGKSTASIELAHTLASEYNRKVAYVAKEEGIGATIKEKFDRLGAYHSNIDIYSNRLPDNPEKYNYIFIDSVNEFGIEYDELSKMQHDWKSKGINPVYVFKGTKDGSFRGSQEFEHLVDVSIKTDAGIARTEKSRFGGKGALVIYTDESQNIPKFSELTKAEGYRNKEKNKMFITKGEDGKFWVVTPAMADLMKAQGFEIF